MTSVMEAAPVGMLVASAEGTILLVNSQIERMFGYPREELVGATLERLVPERLRAPGEFPLEVTLRPFPTADGARTIVSVRDTSTQADADRRLIEAEQVIAVLDDRQRIARDLHDRIARRIFAAGTAVHALGVVCNGTCGTEGPNRAPVARIEWRAPAR